MNSRRTARTRSATNENGDENRGATTRVTRAKAASLSSGTTALAPKQSNTTLGGGVAGRKRAALGDVSNVHKTDPAGDKKAVKKTSSRSISVAKTTSTTATTKTTRRSASTTKSVTSTSQATKATERTKKRPAPATVKEEVEVVEEENVENVAPSTKLAVEVETETKDHSRAAKRPRVDDGIRACDVPGWVDLDEEDAEDPLMVSEYVNEIFEYLKEIEPQTQPNPDYMDDQEDLQWQMRGILIDWLVEVHTRFRLLPETLFLAVNIVDRFLSNKVVLLEKLQLVGVTAMFIAAKYEEVFSPHVQYFRHVADDGFAEEEILRAERFILATLDYNLSYPNPMNFLRRISKADEYDFQTRTFAKYIMEVSLVDHRFMKYLPSHVAAAAMYMSRMMLNRGPWDANLIHYSDYTEEQILPVFRLLLDYLIRPVKHEAFYKKYATKKFMKASMHARSWAKKVAKDHGVTINNTGLYDDEA